MNNIKINHCDFCPKKEACKILSYWDVRCPVVLDVFYEPKYLNP